MSTEEELLAKEEARLKRLGEKGRGNVFGGGLTAAQNRGRKLSGGASAPPAHSAPTYKPVTTHAPAPATTHVSRPYQPPVHAVEETYHLPPPSRPAHGEVISEPIINPSKVVDSAEEAAKEEERMMKSIGKFARPETVFSSGISGNSAPAAKAPVTTTYQPPRGPPPSSQIRAHSGTYNPPPLESEVVEEELALPMPTRPSNTAKVSPRYNAHAAKPANFVYPQFKVGQLVPADNGMANILPINDLACQLSELTIGLKNDGKAIEFRRSVVENGKPRNESQLFNLPYQVSGNTCTASFSPHDGNGTVRIKLGKIVTGQVPKGDRQLLEFQVRGNPSSNSDRVQISIDQQPDHYRFFPGEPSRYDTDFTVWIVGQTLEFRSTYSIEEEEGVKTINGTQKVQLPLLPTLDQIDVGFDSVTIWPARTSGGPVHVPEQEIRIVQV